MLAQYQPLQTRYKILILLKCFAGLIVCHSNKTLYIGYRLNARSKKKLNPASHKRLWQELAVVYQAAGKKRC